MDRECSGLPLDLVWPRAKIRWPRPEIPESLRNGLVGGRMDLLGAAMRADHARIWAGRPAPGSTSSGVAATAPRRRPPRACAATSWVGGEGDVPSVERRRRAHELQQPGGGAHVGAAVTAAAYDRVVCHVRVVRRCPGRTPPVSVHAAVPVVRRRSGRTPIQRTPGPPPRARAGLAGGTGQVGRFAPAGSSGSGRDLRGSAGMTAARAGSSGARTDLLLPRNTLATLAPRGGRGQCTRLRPSISAMHTVMIPVTT